MDKTQIDKLADFIMAEIDGEPSRSEGAGDCAIRIIKQLEAENTQLKRVFDNAAKRIATGTSKRLKFRCSHCQKNTLLLIDALLADTQGQQTGP